jgi:2-polyprenyl-6-methoxyphenol hydroxylase-like FAD-dependent oxidoreductase
MEAELHKAAAMSGAEGPLRIAVAGGSIGGLCAGLTLRGAGFDVQVYERVSGSMEPRGAGIVVQGELIDLLRTHGAGALPTTRCAVRRYLSPEGGEGKVQRAPQDFTSWEAIYRTLADAFPSERYHRGAMLTDFGNGKGAVRAHIDGHGVVEADVLVAADGAQSATRRRFLPHLSSTYAGYVAWRGTLDEASVPPKSVVKLVESTSRMSPARCLFGGIQSRQLNSVLPAAVKGCGRSGSIGWRASLFLPLLRPLLRGFCSRTRVQQSVEDCAILDFSPSASEPWRH